MIVPAFMYPSLATQGEQGHQYSGKKMLFFIVSAILIAIMLCAIGAALQHSELSNGSINLCFSAFPSVIMLIFDFFLLNKAGDRVDPAHLKSSLMIYVGFGLLVVPQFLSNMITICQEAVITKNSERRGQAMNKGRQENGEYSHDLLAEF